MNKHILIAAFVPALMLGACGGTVNRGLESVHQPVVSRADYVFDVGTSGNALAPGEGDRLGGWMRSIGVGYGDRISIDDPASAGGYGSSGIREDVQTQAARYGLLVADAAPVSGAPVTPGTVRVIVTRMRASVPTCPDYSRVSGIDYNANTSSNHGCSSNSNLAAMVANPVDLVRGQPGADVNDPAQATRAIETYRKAPTAGGGGGAKTGGK